MNIIFVASRRLSHRLGAALLIAALLTVGVLTSTEQTVAASNDLATQVTIRRDTYGVPHILAENEAAAAYGHGYVTAEDHIL